jgi:hypothetical protein
MREADGKRLQRPNSAASWLSPCIGFSNPDKKSRDSLAGSPSPSTQCSDLIRQPNRRENQRAAFVLLRSRHATPLQSCHIRNVGNARFKPS